MNCKLPPEVQAYLEAVEADKPRACPEQHALAAHIRRCFETEDLLVDTEQLRRYLSLSRYFPYKDLFLWEQFLTALWMCTYTSDGRPRWKTLFSWLAVARERTALSHLSPCAAPLPTTRLAATT